MRRLTAGALIAGVVACAGGPGPTSIDARAFGAVYQSGHTLEAALASGVTYLRFTELLLTFATELALAAPRVHTDAERALLTHYRTAATPLQDSLQVWSLHLDRGPRIARGVGPVDAVFAKYGIAPGSDAWWDLAAGREALWRRALVDLAMANRLYESAPRPAP